MAVVRLTQLDGSLPNYALMRLAAFHRDRGDQVHFHRGATRRLEEPAYDVVYASAIFTETAPRVQRFRLQFPGAIVGGTYAAGGPTVEEIVGDSREVDYSPWPAFRASLGFTQRGCRLKCKFCVVPGKEGPPAHYATINEVWRGEGHPRLLHLLDNDFFGGPAWRERVAEIRAGNFRACFNQGINIRKVTDETAEALASVQYRDDAFQRRTLYTAWDNLKDEEVFFAGVDCLERAGVPPQHLRAYMLVGFAKGETWARVLHRFDRMVERGIEPYPMVFGDKDRGLEGGGLNVDLSRRTLRHFQRWALTGLYRAVRFDSYRPGMKRDRGEQTADLFSLTGASA